MIEADELLEYAIVYNDYKGIPKDQVRKALDSGKDVIMRIDVQGAETIRELCPDALLIFLSTESEEELEERLRSRKTESKEGLKLRIATARQEMKQVDQFDYYVINHEFELENTVDKIMAIVTAEHLRTSPRQVDL